jgi:uncharacterized protein (DUF1697 family)
VADGPTHAAFLRAVNLGATRKAPSAKLIEIFEGLGFEEVATFRTSGNVVFHAGGGSDAKLRSRIEDALEDGLGFEVPAFVRSARELKAIARHSPFPPKAVADPKGKLQVALLEKSPSAGAKKRVMALGSDDDRLALKGTELYWLPSGGTQQSPLDLKVIDQAVGLNTLRTQGTIAQLYEKFFG